MQPRTTLTAAAVLAAGALLGYLAASVGMNPLRSADAAEPRVADAAADAPGGLTGKAQAAGSPIAGSTGTHQGFALGCAHQFKSARCRRDRLTD